MSASAMEDLELPAAASSGEQDDELDFWRAEVNTFLSTLKPNIKVDQSELKEGQRKIIVHIEPNQENSIGCSIDLRIGYKKGYPYKPPSLRIVKSPNIKGSMVDVLQDSIFKQAGLFAAQCSKLSDRKRGLIGRIVQMAENKLDEYVKTKNIELSPASQVRMSARADLALFLRQSNEQQEKQKVKRSVKKI